MKKLLVLLAALLLVAIAVPAAFADVELGISATPGIKTDSGQDQTITGFHIGYNWGILYGSWDALAMPAVLVSNMTGYWDDVNQFYVSGPYVPGFLNLYDVGLRIVLQPFLLYTELGVNNLYVYKNLGNGGSFGANLRLGAGLKFGFWGVNVSGTAVFSSFGLMADTLKKLVAESTRQEAISQIGQGLVPSINLTFYF